MNKIVSFILGYFSGSFPSAYIVGKLFKKFDMRKVGNGRIGAAFSYKIMGKKFGIIVGILDFSKGFLPLLLLSWIGEDKTSLLFSGIGAMVGHNWSIFMQFKGGLGALVMYGVFFYIYTFEFLLSLLPAIIFYFLVRNSYYATFFIILWVSFTSILTKKDISLFLLPFILFLVMSFKKKMIKEELNA